MITELALADLHRHQQQHDKSIRFTLMGCERKLDPRRALARRFEREVRQRIADLGITIVGTSHKCNYDLLAQGVRIEVKASTWNGTAYQANLHGNQADVLVWGCLDGALHWFVIPFDEVAGRRKLEITQHDPRDYHGQWMRYYEAWDILDQFIAAGRNAWQPSLIKENLQ